MQKGRSMGRWQLNGVPTTRWIVGIWWCATKTLFYLGLFKVLTFLANQKFWWAVIIACVLAFVLTGCAPRYVPVHHYHEVESVRTELDSIHYTDTVRITEQGDTVRIEVTRWRTRYRTTTDTLVRTDTVQLPPQLVAPQPERRGLPWWGWLLIGAIVPPLTYLAVRVWRRY